MNRTKLKNYAPQARRDFIQAMTGRAAFYGLTAKKIEPIVERGDVAMIAGRAFPNSIVKKRRHLEDRVEKHGFAQTMEALAYTWFNRLVAIRFMELHGYLEHGYRVLSPSPHRGGGARRAGEGATASSRGEGAQRAGEGGTPEILEHAEHVELPGLNRDTIIELKLDGTKEPELYRRLLIAQCNALHDAMPFLFEKIEDETEVVLPENLLHSDSLIRKLVGEIDEEDWQEVEIIGWLYQFYISEKKAEVIGKVVASEDIPAATQLFTPNWIVKYLVQNTLGRQWLATYPQSSLRGQMDYFIEPAEQTPEVQEQLKAITPTSPNPEELTLLDPACGSGHILVEAYELFKAIYQERGYRAKDIPALILQKNLFGLEIDDRAAQLAAFALMMKARADDRRIFDSDVKPNILAFQDSQGLDAAAITHALNAPINNQENPPSEFLFEEIENTETPLFSKNGKTEKGRVAECDIASFLAIFENAKTFGSLIQVPRTMETKLAAIEHRLNDLFASGDLISQSVAKHMLAPIEQAAILGRRFDIVLANPPYMGSKGMNSLFKVFGKQNYPNGKADLYAMFMERLVAFAAPNGWIGIMSPFTWMFISSYELLRRWLIGEKAIVTLVQPEYHAFFESAYVPICAFVVRNMRATLQGDYFRLTDFYGEDIQASKLLDAICNPDCGWRFQASADDFQLLPGAPIAYWISRKMRQCFLEGLPLGAFAAPTGGMTTGNNARFVRAWHEVNIDRIGFRLSSRPKAIESKRKWFPYNKGGEYRRWFGNNTWVVDWENDGEAIIRSGTAFPRSKDRYFQPGLTWTDISSSYFGLRSSDEGFLFDATGSSVFPTDEWRNAVAGFMLSKIASVMLTTLNPTMHFQVGNVSGLPLLQVQIEARKEAIDRLVTEAIHLSRTDWDSLETSWEFQTHPARNASGTVQHSLDTMEANYERDFGRMKALEAENNRLFLEAYGLQDEISQEVTNDQITLYRPNREEDIKRLLSYAIGCIMGRYSLDKPGLIYAHSGNQGFDPSQYTTFGADDDGVIPLVETDWGIRDDAPSRIVEFIGVAWPKDDPSPQPAPQKGEGPLLEENLKFLADSLGPTGNEQPRDTIRRYLATGFYKHHLSMYKRRPIYWLFSSGKLRAFQCLVYLHRYHEGTLARMRTEYVIPLQGQIASRIEQLEGDKAKATSTSHRNKLQKEQDKLKKQQAELGTFEEKLKHAAEQKISLDLDDGVKVNYGKFGDLLAEVKAVTGGKDED